MILRDPVHGLVAFESEEDAIVVRLLQAREVQRLRRIRQLGLTSFAFPSAEHTRFSHAIGAAHVMKLFLARLRQVDRDLPFWQRVTSERARDAIAAAFLHDLGHGPLSHLFEEAMPGAPHHEAWTTRILLDPSSDVHRILVADDPYLPQRVADLIHGKHPLPYLAKAVSGTFDVDRCDYLLRDAHATGVRYGEYDLPWLLRSLRFDDAPQPGLAIDGTKGLAPIEAFILARLFMFQQVYFHKSTRSAEWMIGAILRRALALVADGVRLPALPPALATAAAGDAPTLGEYLELDDQVLLVAIHEWENATDPILADLCKRLRARALFKTIELFHERGGYVIPPDEALAKAREIAAAAGLDPQVYVGIDTAEDTPYADDASLKVVFPRGRARSPSEVSFLLDRLRNETLTRVRAIFAPELRDAMREALLR
ncbi:Deoxyguanosinetriphosphate triphosphohydrolase [Minicystis rosea]|nr:Deoxyguanosinetriphosphate triphosphohydrolase [Minicystis rosea]